MVRGLRPVSAPTLLSFAAADSSAVTLPRTDMAVPIDTFLADEAADEVDAARPVCPGLPSCLEVSESGGLRRGRRTGGFAVRGTDEALAGLTAAPEGVRAAVDGDRAEFAGDFVDRSEVIDGLPRIGCLPVAFAVAPAVFAVATVLIVAVVLVETVDVLGEDVLGVATLPLSCTFLGVLGLREA